MKKSTYLSALAAAAILSSCSNYDEPTKVYLNGELQVSAAIDQIKTRYSDNAFAANDEIGISGGDFSNVKFVTTDGVAFSAAGDKIMIAENAEAVSFTAYAPYIADGGTITFTEPVDYLFAAAQEATYDNPKVKFDFKHVMSKVTLNLNPGEGVEEKGIKVTLAKVVKGGSFNTETGAITPSETKGNVSAESSENSVSLILPPSTTAQEANLSLTFNDKSYSGTLNIPALTAGYQYNYTITIKAGETTEMTPELEMQNPSMIGWTSDDSNNGTLEVVEDENMITEVGDYLLKDGSVLDQNSPRFNDKKSDIVGVVYYVKGEEDKIDLKNFGYEFNNGLAIALKNAGQGRFNKNNADYKSWCTDNSSDISGLYTEEMNMGGSGPKEGLFAGYNNTQILLAAKGAPTTTGSGENIVEDTDGSTFSNELLALLTTSNENKVDNASEWYLPNFGELYSITANIETINQSLNKAGGDKLVKVENYERGKLTEGWYWTSTLRGTNNAWVSVIDNTVTLTELYENRNSNGKKGYFRFAIAF